MYVYAGAFSVAVFYLPRQWGSMPTLTTLRFLSCCAILGSFIQCNLISHEHDGLGASKSQAGGVSESGQALAQLHKVALTQNQSISASNVSLGRESIQRLGGSVFRDIQAWVGLSSGYAYTNSHMAGGGALVGATLELVLGQFSLWGAGMTGQLATKTYALQTPQYSVALKDGGNFGLLVGRVGLSYSYELFSRVSLSLGVGVEYARYNTAYVTFGSMYSPMIMPGLSMSLGNALSFGVQMPITRAYAATLTANGSQFDLNTKEELFTAQFLAVLKYRFR